MKKEINKYQIPDIERNNKIINLREGGMTFVEIAKKMGLSPQRCNEIYKKYKLLEPPKGKADL